MKTAKLISLTCLIAFACACTKGVETDLTQEQGGKTRYAEQTPPQMLSFGSLEEMLQQIQALELMTPEASAAWYEQQGNFVSQAAFMWQIIEELEQAASMQEVLQIQDSYRNVVLFNDNPADEDISPYIPSTSPGTEFVCNPYGNVLIGDKVMNFNNITSYTQTQDYIFAHPQKTRAVTKISGVSAQTSNRKFWAEAYFNDQTGIIEIALVAHKKGTFGWNKYKTSYSLRMLQLKNWNTIWPFAVDIRNAAPNYYTTSDNISSGSRFPFVSGRPENNPLFLMSVYSRGVGANNAKDLGVIGIPKTLSKAKSAGESYGRMDMLRTF